MTDIADANTERQIADAVARMRLAKAEAAAKARASTITEGDLLSGYGNPPKQWAYHVSEWCSEPCSQPTQDPAS